jgi:hypothetical protein
MSRIRVLTCALLLSFASAFATTDGPATLPRVTPSAVTPTPGAVIPVLAGANLQVAINAANCGDVLQLQAGASFVGNFTLPNKGCTDAAWIQIRTSSPDGVNGMPLPGTRITPCRAGVTSLPGRPAYPCANPQHLMANVTATKSGTAFTLAPGASHYHLGPGLEITRQVGTGINYALIAPFSKSPADHLVIERDWIHGTAHDDTTRGVFLSGVVYAVIRDSYINDFHCTAAIGTCSDAQAISGGTGPVVQGQWLIANNFLEASTEVILFGGVVNNSTTPTDVTIRRNHFFKPLTWMPGQPGFVGGFETATATCPHWDPTGSIGMCPFVVKNLFELKNAQRLLFEGNILENTWPGFTQHGNAILLSGLNPPAVTGATVYSTISLADITLRYNRVSHATSGMVIANMATPVPNLPVTRISAHDMLFDDLSPAYSNGDGSVTAALPFQIGNCPACIPISDVSIQHITMLLQAPKIGFILGAYAPALMPGINFSNNIVTVPAGVTITSPSGTVCLGATNFDRIANCFATPYNFAGNALIGATGVWPSGNGFPATAGDVDFTNYNGGVRGDYTLALTSPYKNTGTDGKDPGANVAAVNAATIGVQ